MRTEDIINCFTDQEKAEALALLHKWKRETNTEWAKDWIIKHRGVDLGQIVMKNVRRESKITSIRYVESSLNISLTQAKSLVNLLRA